MSVEAELASLSSSRDMLLTIGVFDGVHLGHKRLIAELIRQARQKNLLPGVITFRQHPEEITHPDLKLSFLTCFDKRVKLLKDEGVSNVIALSFTPELARLEAHRFVTLLQKHLRMRGLVVGPDFALGRGREGSISALESLGREMGFSVTIVPPVLVNGEVASSTAIRRALTAGDMGKVCSLAGRPYCLHGKVIKGAGRGAGLGFPTANLEMEPGLSIPADGIYASRVRINDQAYPSMTYIGRCPTFNNGQGQVSVEVYILDFYGDLYEQDLRVEIVARIRGDRKFNTPEALKKQMAEDVRQGRAILGAREKTK